MASPAEIRARALGLSRTERAKLVHDLLQSLDDDTTDEPGAVEAAWAAEITRRVEDVRSGKADLIDADHVHADIRARLAAKRPR